MRLDDALHDDNTFFELVSERGAEIREFLQRATAYEAGEGSLRFERRPDLAHCRQVVPEFPQAWWGVVVYTCFDSLRGTRAAATEFSEPLPAAEAERAIAEVAFPLGSVQNHRTQVTLTRAKKSLVSACEKSAALERILTTAGPTFDERFAKLGQLHVFAWGRTTNFDALARGGVLELDGAGYRPQRAYLESSQGPAAGFEKVWGIAVTQANADQCEALLVRWTSLWQEVATQVESQWQGGPYDSADFENALCIYQHRS